MTRPRGLFTEEGRAKLAKLIVHGADGNKRYYPHVIEVRIEAVLERIAKKLEAATNYRIRAAELERQQ